MKEQHGEQLQAFLDIARAAGRGGPFSSLFKRVLAVVRSIMHAEGGSLYIHDDVSRTLKVVLLQNTPLKTEKVYEEFDPSKVDGFITVPLDGDELGVSARAFLTRKTVVIADVYKEKRSDMENVRRFDEANNYKTHSMVAVPLLGHDNEPVGVMQIINPSPESLEKKNIKFLESLAMQAGVSLNNALLVSGIHNLLNAFVRMVGMAIDEKSPHTAGHCTRVTEVTMMLAEAMVADSSGRYKDFTMDEDELNELRLAALLHDIGKIVTPNHILEKNTKLAEPLDRVELVRLRFETEILEQQLAALRARVREAGREDLLDEKKDLEIRRRHEEECTMVQKLNVNEIFPEDDIIKQVDGFASRRILQESNGGEGQPLVEEQEAHNLKIKRGTLNEEERHIMEDHVRISIRLLSSLPWPRNLRNIPEYAGGHHENINGTGYPNKITGDQMSLPAKILGIADRFEGLAAPDRPYRSPLKLSRVLFIMEAMRKDGHIDPEMYDFFLESEIPQKYAKLHLPPEYVDWPPEEKEA